jgi:hypothetical protein
MVLCAALLLSSAFAADKGNCPPIPPNNSVQTNAPSDQTTSAANPDYVGTVNVMAVISDKGFVCDARVLKGIDKDTNEDAVTALKGWTFKPATKDGRAVPTVVSVSIKYVRKDGKVVRATDSPTQ